MKRSLLLNSLLLSALLLYFGCQNHGAKQVKADSAKPDSVETMGGGPQPGTGSGTASDIGGGGIVKPSGDTPGNPRPIIHGSPDQVRLDSIKAAKAKEKSR